MTTTVVQFDESRSRAATARKVSEHLIIAADSMQLDTESAVAGLVQAAYDIATSSKQPGMARRTAATFRALAGMIEEIETARSVAPH